MNKRIGELILQAGFDNDGDEFEYSVFDGCEVAHCTEPLHNLIKLVVQECVKVCADRGAMHDGLYSAWAEDCSKRIEKQFE